MKLNRWFRNAVVMMGLAALMAGCSRSAALLDKREDRDPLIRRARLLKSGKDIDGAIQAYGEALDRKPELARAHLEVGLLYDKYREDYVRAIFHYQRYIELRPTADKNHYIEELIDKAKLAYAASLPDRPSAAVDEIAFLRKEINRLKDELARYHPAASGGSAAKVVSTGTAAAPGLRDLKPAPAQPAVDTYKVQPGETLSSIASKVYNDPRQWEKIYEANRATLSSPQSLRPGQTLIVPGS